MELSLKNMQGVSVRTQSGQALGRVSDVKLDGDSGRLTHIAVRTRGLLPGFGGDLLVAWSQIVTMSRTEVIVADAAVPRGATSIAKAIPQ